VGLVGGSITGANSVGGLVGTNEGTINAAYITGNVSGTNQVGALVGANGGTISNVYATGNVNGTNEVGGLVGNHVGTISSAYWNTTTSSQTVGVGNGSSTGTTGLTTAQLQQQASFTGFTFTNSNTGWFIYEGHTAPLLNAFLTPLTITADSQTQTYSGTGSALALSNAVYSIPGADVSGGLFGLGSPYGNAVNVGTYAPQLWSHQQGYRITLTGGTLQITPKALTVTGVVAQNKTYDGTTSAALTAAGSLSGLVNGETLTLATNSLTADFDDKNAGTGKTVTVGGYAIGNGTGLASNYVLDTTPLTTADITPKTLMVTANDLIKYSDDHPHQGGSGVIYSGFVAGEGASALNGLLTYTANSQGAVQNGQYLITPDGLSANNYVLRFVDGILTIRSRPTNQTEPITASLLQHSCGGASPGSCGNDTSLASLAVEPVEESAAYRMALTEDMVNTRNPARCLKGGKLLSAASCS
jgi:hypothetical protein